MFIQHKSLRFLGWSAWVSAVAQLNVHLGLPTLWSADYRAAPDHEGWREGTLQSGVPILRVEGVMPVGGGAWPVSLEGQRGCGG